MTWLILEFLSPFFPQNHLSFWWLEVIIIYLVHILYWAWPKMKVSVKSDLVESLTDFVASSLFCPKCVFWLWKDKKKSKIIVVGLPWKFQWILTWLDYQLNLEQFSQLFLPEKILFIWGRGGGVNFIANIYWALSILILG